MKKNGASQHVGAQMITSADGTDFSGTVTVYVTGDAGTQAIGSVGSGLCASEGHGYYTYAPAQAETNYDVVAFTFTGTGAISATRELYTDFPQTGDSYARIGAPVGASISADVAGVQTTSTAINAKTTNLPASPASTTNITAGTITTATNVTTVNGLAANTLTASALATDAVTEIQTGLSTATAVAAIAAKTNSLTFTVAGVVDANLQYINDVQLTGNGQSGTKFGV